jgi:hypothetical protein
MNNAKRGRRLRAGIASAAVALTMGAGASAAQAVPFQAEFDNAFLKTGAFPNPGLDILGGTSVPPFAEFGGDLTIGAPSTFTVPAACTNPGTPTANGFCFPDFSGTVLGGAVGVTVKLQALAPVTGTVDGTTGAVTTNTSNYKATLILDFTPLNLVDPVDICEITPIPMAFNTTQPFPAPYAGDPFTVVLADLATDALDNGAVSTTWASLPAANFISGPSGTCATVDSLSGGRGGIWIADNIATPVINAAPPAPPTTTTPPATTPKKCKKGQKLKKGKCVKKKKKKK